MWDGSVSVAIVFHSGLGHTARIADAVRDGSTAVEKAVAQLISLPDRQHRRHTGRNGSTETSTAQPIVVHTITDEQWRLLDRADAIIFGSPTYMGDVSAVFRLFVEQSSPRMQTGAWRNKLAAGFVNSGSMSGDKVHALQSLAVFAARHDVGQPRAANWLER